MTLTERVEQFLYTHPVQHHQKALLELVRSVELTYLRRIAELEAEVKRPQSPKERVTEKPPAKRPSAYEDDPWDWDGE